MRTFIASIGISIAAFLLYFAPMAASAATANIQTAQLLPPGQNACPAAQLLAFKEYVYEGSLNSYDIFLADASYVAVAGTVGNTQIPFSYMTRSIDSQGVLRIHVDTPSIAVRDTAPITLTLISSLPGRQTCLSAVSVVLDGTSIATVGTTAPGQNQQPVVSNNKGKTGKSTPSTNKALWGKEKKADAASKTGSAEAASSSSLVGESSQTSVLNKICTTEGGATRLWTILLAVYFLIIAATILALPDGKLNTPSSILLGIAVAVPLLVLLSIWKAAPSCHVGKWAPVAALLIAGMGLVLGLRHHPKVSRVLFPPKSK